MNKSLSEKKAAKESLREQLKDIQISQKELKVYRKVIEIQFSQFRKEYDKLLKIESSEKLTLLEKLNFKKPKSKPQNKTLKDLAAQKKIMHEHLRLVLDKIKENTGRINNLQSAIIELGQKQTSF
jgi:predicted nuclease with TOPRIM domain